MPAGSTRRAATEQPPREEQAPRPDLAPRTGIKPSARPTSAANDGERSGERGERGGRSRRRRGRGRREGGENNANGVGTNQPRARTARQQLRGAEANDGRTRAAFCDARLRAPAERPSSTRFESPAVSSLARADADSRTGARGGSTARRRVVEAAPAKHGNG